MPQNLTPHHNFSQQKLTEIKHLRKPSYMGEKVQIVHKTRNYSKFSMTDSEIGSQSDKNLIPPVGTYK